MEAGYLLYGAADVAGPHHPRPEPFPPPLPGAPPYVMWTIGPFNQLKGNHDE
jgi:hypothetical protein